MGSAYQFHSWRVFVIVCALPCVCSVVALTFMPESPRFLLEVTLTITYTQGSHIRWKPLLVNSREVCWPLWEVCFSFQPWHSGGFGVVETCFQPPACGQAALGLESTHVPPQPSNFLFSEENVAYCFIGEILPPVGATSSGSMCIDLLRYSRIPSWSVCSTGTYLNVFAVTPNWVWPFEMAIGKPESMSVSPPCTSLSTYIC